MGNFGGRKILQICHESIWWVLNLADFKSHVFYDVTKWLPLYLTSAFSLLFPPFQHSDEPSSPSRTGCGTLLSYLCPVFGEQSL